MWIFVIAFLMRMVVRCNSAGTAHVALCALSLTKNLTQKRNISVETASGIILLKLLDNGEVTVNMGSPSFAPETLPFLVGKQQEKYTLALNNIEVEISALSMGNPHAVVIVDNVETAKVLELGPQIESHQNFPEHVNAGFMEIVSQNEIKLRVFERGSGETLACGTGACAAVVSGIQLNLLQSPVLVNTRGGSLNIEWVGNDSAVMMTGPAKIVFEGTIEI